VGKVPIADRWFERSNLGDGITLLWEPHVHPLLRCNIWHLSGESRDMLVDFGLGICSLREAAEDLFGKQLIAVATHYHNDHVGGMAEFSNDTCVIHQSEAQYLQEATDEMALTLEQLGDDLVRIFTAAGYQFDDENLLSAYPYEGFVPEDQQLRPVTPSYTLAEGDVIDLGNRCFEVLHLPGHSPGSIGLWEKQSRTLFSGDASYDGPLLDGLIDSDRDAYARTMERLLELPVDKVLPGHDKPFGRDRHIEIARAYLKALELDQEG
jgi:glyoxylase-like metal-dependent hydrolase (beta-lactamase superfamily II)